LSNPNIADSSSPCKGAFLDAFNEICRSEYQKRIGPDEAPITIRPQALIGGYRCSFLIEQGATKIVVERERLGQDFIDQYLEALGHTVFWFNNEISIDAELCARQVFNFITRRAGERAAIRNQILGEE
jgi:hypothetical protein